MNEWRDILSAPTDGTEIMVLMRPHAHHPGGEFKTKWGKLKNWYVWDWLIDGFEHGTWDTVTHWKPL